MNAELVAPKYDGDALVNLLPSVAACLRGEEPIISLPRAKKYVVLMVDGLGYELSDVYAGHAENLTRLDRLQLTCSVPSTTATSLTSLGTGYAPGRHGVVGYSFYEPSVAAIVNALTWENGPRNVSSFRQVPTKFQQLRMQGRSSAAVTLQRFAGSALTALAFAGTELVARPSDENEVSGVVERVSQALTRHDIVYCYERLLDHSGHSYGFGSWQWLEQLVKVDDMVAALLDVASEDVCVLVTGDHGMVNVPVDRRIVAEDHDELAGFQRIGGEGRFRQLYGPKPEKLAAAWQTFLGERAVVVTKEDAIARGWFGPEVSAKTLPRIGDVLVVMLEDWAVMSRRFAGEFTLVGMHGSLTSAEMLVPLFSVGGRR